MINFCTRVECKQAVPFFSLMTARILLDAYLTISPSKVAVITNAPTPLEMIWESRNPDPLWITALKITSYVLLAPLALLALFAKWALYCKPLHTYAPLITKEPPQPQDETLCAFLKRGEDAGRPEVQAAIATIISKGENEIKSTLRRLKDVFKASFPGPGVKKDYQNGSLLTKQQKTYVKNYVAIRTQLAKAFLPEGDAQWQSYLDTENNFVRDVVCWGWVKLLKAVYNRIDNYMTGYAALKAYHQDVLECYAVAFAAAGLNETVFAAKARNEVMALLIHMATTRWTGFYPAFCFEYYDTLEEHQIAQFPKLKQTLEIAGHVYLLHEQMHSKKSITLTSLHALLDRALA